MSSREGSTHNFGSGAHWAGFTLSWMGGSDLCAGSLTIRTLQTGSKSLSGSGAMDTEI